MPEPTPADRPDQTADILQSIPHPVWPVPSVLERAMSEAVDYWQGEARWWRRCAYAGWAAAVGVLVALVVWRLL